MTKKEGVYRELHEIRETRASRNKLYDELCSECGKPRGVTEMPRCDGYHIWRLPIGK